MSECSPKFIKCVLRQVNISWNCSYISRVSHSLGEYVSSSLSNCTPNSNMLWFSFYVVTGSETLQYSQRNELNCVELTLTLEILDSIV